MPPETSRKRGKKKDGPTKGRELLPDHGCGDTSLLPEAQVKRVRKKAKKVPPEPATEVDAVPTEMLVYEEHERPQEAAPVTADASLHEVVNPDMPKQVKTGEQEPPPVKAKGGAKKSKSELVDPAGDAVIDFAKSLKRKVPKKKVQSKMSTAGAKDDIDKTIAALLDRRMQADPTIISDPVAEIELTVPPGSDVLTADPPLTGVRKRSRLKTGPSLEENRRSSKLRRLLASQEMVEEETATADLHPTSDHRTNPLQLSQLVSGPVRRGNTVHAPEDHSFVKGASSITAHIAQTEVNVNSRPVASKETTVTLPALTGNAQSVPSDLTDCFSTGNAVRNQLSPKAFQFQGYPLKSMVKVAATKVLARTRMRMRKELFHTPNQ